jgi:radical SAM superfamily enzyme YgiQ (UPF0313 family)
LKILLISPCQDPARRTPGPLQMPQMALPILAALTPEKHEVRVVEEEFEDIDFSLTPDLVGISMMTANAPRGYLVARRFREKGARIVIGGMHPSVLPDESQAHADAVVVGEGEPVWPELVADAEAGRLKPRYKAEAQADLASQPHPRRDLMPRRRFMNLAPVTTTRGCPYRCEFCSVPAVFGLKIRHYPVDWIVEDVKRSGSKYHMILDDNVVGQPSFAIEMFKALKPLRIIWVGQASMSFAHNEELMRLAHESGCRGLFFGLETVSETSMKRMKKSFSGLAEVEEGIRAIQAHGIKFHASVVFIFDETVDFLVRTRAHSVTFNILTPYPGTAVYDRLKAEGRLFTEDWFYYDHTTVVFRPQTMTAQALAEGQLQARRRFYSFWNILRRSTHHLRNPVFYSAVNLAMRFAARRATLPLAPPQAAPEKGA